MGLGDDLNPFSDKGSLLSLPGDAYKAAKGLVTPTQADTSAIKGAQQRTAAANDYTNRQLVNFHPQYNPAQQQQLYGQGQGAIAGLTAAANGTVPSTAELQLQRQASLNAARGYGQAAALGGLSPGMALRSAQLNAAQTQGDTNQQAAALRAQEQANARGQLVGAIRGQQGALQSVRAGDISQQGNLIQGDLGTLNANTNAALGVTGANEKNAAGQNAFKSDLVNFGTKLALL